MTLSAPLDTAPEFGEPVALCDGAVWMRVPLPMSIGHMNVYLLQLEDGWVLIDTGIGDARALDWWQNTLDGPLRRFDIRAVLVTHAHVDHIGGAGWLCRALGAELWMGRQEYLVARLEQADTGQAGRELQRAHFRSHGLSAETAEGIADFRVRERASISELPDQVRTLEPGTALQARRQKFQITAASGHSTAQILLHAPQDGIFLAADQLLPETGPLLHVPPWEPEADAYGKLLHSLKRIEADVAEDCLILPGHFAPRRGLRAVTGAIRAHHARRYDLFRQMCRQTPIPLVAAFEPLFGPGLNPRQCNFALGETLAYANRMVAEGKAVWQGQGRGIRRLAAA